tara:strand:- start:4336 stop:4578 length:243 start_codon:yes stop_codon:yes gene_type:complete
MKEFSLELESEVKSAIDSVDFLFDEQEGLIQNQESISLDAAKDFNPLLLLRWKQRECVECGVSFDISVNGLLYRCGECVV